MILWSTQERERASEEVLHSETLLSANGAKNQTIRAARQVYLMNETHFAGSATFEALDDVELSWDLFELIKELGRGASGTAELVRRKCDGALMVIKCIPVSGWAVKCVTDICLMRTGKYSGG